MKGVIVTQALLHGAQGQPGLVVGFGQMAAPTGNAACEPVRVGARPQQIPIVIDFPDRLEQSFEPRMWSICSWVNKTASRSVDLSPKEASAPVNWRIPMPQSTSTRVPSASISVAFPLLPLANTHNRMAIILAGRGRDWRIMPGWRKEGKFRG